MDALHIAFFRGSSADTILAEDLCSLDAAGRGAAQADLNWATISLVADGQERLAQALSLGPLEVMPPQLDAARQRLSRGEPALLRSGVLDQEPGLYLLFEPSGTHTVAISLLGVYGLSMLFPVPPESEQARMIYDYVRDHRDECIAAARQWYDLTEVPFDRATLLQALEREAALGRALLANP